MGSYACDVQTHEEFELRLEPHIYEEMRRNRVAYVSWSETEKHQRGMSRCMNCQCIVSLWFNNIYFCSDRCMESFKKRHPEIATVP